MHRILSKSIFTSIPNRINRSSRCAYSSIGHSILFPDYPSDVPATNYVLNLPIKDQTIDFNQIKPNKSFRAFLKSLIELDAAFESIHEHNQNGLDELTAYLEKHMCHLDYSWAVLNLMSQLKPDQYIMRKNGLAKCSDHMENVRLKRFANTDIYNAMCRWDQDTVDGNDKKLSAEQRKLVDTFLRSAQLKGLHLEEDAARTLELVRTLKEQQVKFSQNVITAGSRFQHILLNPEYASKLPHYLRSNSKDGRSVRLTLEPTIYNHFLKHCDDERERWNVWYANVNKASMVVSKENSNNVLIEEIRESKRNLAKLLGFENYIECVLQDKMADSPSTIKRFVENLHQFSRETYNSDLQSLLRFAENCKTFKSNYLNLWDIPYFVNLTKEYEFRTENVQLYFPFEKVLDGIFEFLSKRFNVEVILDETENQLAWSPNVRLFRLVYQNQVLGSFYLDPYANVRQTQVHQITNRCDSQQLKPLSALLMNFQLPVSGEKTLLSFEDVVVLFRTFGYLLQQNLTQMPYLELSGLNLLEKDAIMLNSEFFSLFPVHCYETLSSCSEHVVSKQPLPLEVHEQLKECRRRYESIELTNELYKSALDLALHVQKDYWKEIATEVWKQYMQPFKLDKENYHLCSMTDLMCGLKSGAYYSGKWTEALAADLFTAYLESEDKQKVLTDYTSRFLFNREMLDLKQNFQKFRGRNPLLDPLLKLSKLGNPDKPISMIE